MCKSERKKCKQLWDIVIQTKEKLTDGKIKNIRLQCRYLRLEFPNMNEFNVKTNCDVPNMLDRNDETIRTNISTHGNNQINTNNVHQARTNNTQEPSANDLCSQTLHVRGDATVWKIKHQILEENLKSAEVKLKSAEENLKSAEAKLELLEKNALFTR